MKFSVASVLACSAMVQGHTIFQVRPNTDSLNDFRYVTYMLLSSVSRSMAKTTDS